MSDDLLLGLDLGTTSARAVLTARDGRILATHAADYPMDTPRPGWAEQDPDAWERAAYEALGACVRVATAPSAIRGIGLTGQMHGATLLDERDQSIRPAILWCDQRTSAQRQAIERHIGLSEVIARTANPPLEGFTAPKLLWVREHEPEAYARIRRVLLPKDFIRLRLTGEAATDVADASGTALFDVAKREWSESMARDLDISLEWLSRVVESPEPAGALTAAAAESLGLPAGLPVAGGAGDQAAGGVAAGIVTEGDALVTIGSSGVVFVAGDQPRIDPAGRVHTFCHALPNAWHVMGVTQGAGISLRWVRDTLGARDSGGDPYDALTREASASPAGSRGLIWLPYLQGERTPHLDPNARGVLFGLTTAHGRGDVVRAVLEGVAFSLRDGLEIIQELGLPARRVKIAGGGARSPIWRQIVADVLGLPISLEPEDRGPAFGAALLAGVAVGVYDSVEEACATTASRSQEVEPDTDTQVVYEATYRLYRDLYPALAGSFAEVASLQE